MFLSVVHAVYVLGVVLDAKSRSKVGNVIAWLGVSLSACAYFGWIATVFRSGFSSEMAGVVVLGVVAAYLATATAAIRRGWADRETINILLVFSLAFLAVAPTMLFSRPWYVTSWSAVAVAAAERFRLPAVFLQVGGEGLAEQSGRAAEYQGFRHKSGPPVYAWMRRWVKTHSAACVDCISPAPRGQYAS